MRIFDIFRRKPKVHASLEDGMKTISGSQMDKDSKDFIQASREGLALQTSAHAETWHFDRVDQWEVDMEIGEITFSLSNGNVAKAPIQVVGTYNLDNDTFMWGWDHPSVPEPLRGHAELAREWGAIRNLDMFTQRVVVCSEEEAWDFTAVANRLGGGNGAYRGPAGSALVFMTFGEISLTKQ